MHYFSTFFKRFSKPCVNFLRVWRKTQFIGNSERTFDSFKKIFLKNLRKCIILAYFSKHLTNHSMIFRAFGPKCKLLGNFENSWWKFHRKIEVFIFYFFENLLLKMEPSEKNTIFLQQFFRFRGGDRFPPFPHPAYALALHMYVHVKEKVNFVPMTRL